MTWWLGLPTSSSHALIGGLAGSAIARQGLEHGFGQSFHALVLGKWPERLLFIALGPLIGLASSFLNDDRHLLAVSESHAETQGNLVSKIAIGFSRALSFSHGTNDARKTMGVITGVLVTSGFHVPTWVILAAHTAIALGTLAGGWRIVHTMGRKLTYLKPRTGFCAETGATVSILFATHLGLPVSTTHCLASTNGRKERNRQKRSKAVELPVRGKHGMQALGS